MKIHQVLDGVSLIITNEERNFINRLGDKVSIPSLDDHDQWLAKNLVRKGVYNISKERGYIVKHTNESNNTKNIR